MTDNWRDNAACKGTDPSVFFPHGDNDGAYAKARDICSGCLVLDDCAEYALSHETDGFYAMMTPRERSRARKVQGVKLIKRPSITVDRESRAFREDKRDQCGTRNGYKVHMRNGSPKCEACRTAMADYQREYRAARRAS